MSASKGLFVAPILKNFIETETWDVVGNFKPVYFTDVVPYYLDGTEIVSHYA